MNRPTIEEITFSNRKVLLTSMLVCRFRLRSLDDLLLIDQVESGLKRCRFELKIKSDERGYVIRYLVKLNTLNRTHSPPLFDGPLPIELRPSHPNEKGEQVSLIRTNPLTAEQMRDLCILLEEVTH